MHRGRKMHKKPSYSVLRTLTRTIDETLNKFTYCEKSPHTVKTEQ